MNTAAFPDSDRIGGSGADTAPQTSQPVLLSDLPAHRAYFSRIGFAMLVLMLGYQLLAYLIAGVVSRVAPALTDEWWYTWVLTDIPLYGAGLPLMWLVLRNVPAAPFNRTCRLRGATVEKPRFGFGAWLLIAVIGMGVMQIGGLIAQGIMKFLSFAVGYDYANRLEAVVSGSPLWVSVIATVVIAPVGEEFIFRKLLIDRTRRWGDTVAVLLSGILFGLFHGNLFQLFYTTMFGFLLAYIYTRTGRLGWCIGLHALINFMGGIVPTLLQNWIVRDILSDPEKLSAHLLQNPVQSLVLSLYIAAIYAFMIAAVVLLICLRRSVRLGDGAYVLPAGQRFRTVILNAGMIAGLLAYLFVLLSTLIIPPLAAHLAA